MTKLVSQTFNIASAKDFIASVSNSAYYVTFGKHTPYVGTDAAIEHPIDSYSSKILTLYDDMIFGKKVEEHHLSLVTNKYIWESNTSYAMYDDTKDLLDENYFVAAPDGSNYNVYKCIYNSMGEPSTVMPSTVDTSVVFESDGYAWKYLYTIEEPDWNTFTTTTFMPLGANSDIQESATDRSIEVILVDYSGSYYNNWTLGSFETGDQLVSTTQFKLIGSASTFNDFYKGCIIEFTTTTGKEYREILSYVVSGSNKTITIDSPVANPVTVGDTYKIYPKVKLISDGSESNTALAWAIVNSESSNSISSIEILNTGKGYRRVSAQVHADESVGVLDFASLRPIVSPVGGHGFDPTEELPSSSVCLSLKLTGTESNNLIADNDFRNIALIKNPYFANVVLHYDGTTSIFNLGEEVVQYKPTQLMGTVTANSSGVYGIDTDFTNSLEHSDKLLIQNSSTSFYTSVNTVVDDTTLTVWPVPASNIATSTISSLRILSSGKVTSYLSNAVFLSDVTYNFNTTNPVLGANSFAIITPTEVVNNGKPTNQLNTFQQTVKFEGGRTSTENFIQDELVYEQGSFSDENLRPTGRLYSYIDDVTDYIFITNENQPFSTTATIVGNTSGATFSSVNKYNGDLIKDSGKVLYITNVEAVSKSNTSTETIKLTLTF